MNPTVPSRLPRAMTAMFAATIALPASANLDIVWSNQATAGFDAAETAVINAAIASWEALIVDYGGAAQAPVFDITITETSTFAVGAITSVTEGISGLPASATMILDDGSSVNQFSSWFIDPTPTQNEEFFATGVTHYGGANAGGPADNAIDYYNVVVHELGHALGFSESYSLWDAATNDASAVLTYGPGQTIDLLGTFFSNSLSHLDGDAAPFDLMLSAGTFAGADGVAGSGGFDDRRVQSALDLDILAGVYGFTVDYSALPSRVPAPGTFATLLVAGSAWGRRKR